MRMSVSNEMRLVSPCETSVEIGLSPWVTRERGMEKDREGAGCDYV